MNTKGHLIFWSVTAPHRSAEILAIKQTSKQPGSLQKSSNAFVIMPWTPSIQVSRVDPFTYFCPPFLYQWAVENHHEHKRLPHLPSQHPIVHLVHLKSWQKHPGSLQIKRICDAMDPIQVCRPVHSHLSSLSISMGSEKPPMKSNGHLIFRRSTPSFS